MRKPDFANAKTKTQISFAVTAKLISVFVFATWIVQSLCYLNPKFQAYSHLLCQYSPVCVGPGRKPRRPVFSERGSNVNSYDEFFVLSLIRITKHLVSVQTQNSMNKTTRPLSPQKHPITH